MAGRKQEVALSYFPLDCDFFTNRKIKALRRAHGQTGILTYIYLLTKIYANGYYLKVADLEEFAYDVAEDIANDRLASVSARVMSVISYLADIGLLDKGSLDKGVLTGKAIQEQYITSVAKMKRTAQIKEYNVTDSTFPVQKSEETAEEMGIDSEEINNDSESMRQTKQKETIDVIITNLPVMRTREEWERLIDDRCCLENCRALHKQVFGNTEVHDLVVKTLLDVATGGKEVTVGGKLRSYADITAGIERMDKYTLTDIAQGFYEEDRINMRWRRKLISSPRNYILAILLAKSEENI